jgi:hypothetical protein
MKNEQPKAFGILNLSPEEFGRMTYGEYQAKLQGYQLKVIDQAFYVGMGFNDPKQLGEIRMLYYAAMEGGKTNGASS